MRYGNLELLSVSGGKFRLDGGAMFGVVPKPLWNRVSQADEHNRIQLDTNCILLTTPNGKTLIDAGFGSELSDREQDQMATSGSAIRQQLAELSIDSDEITRVIPSHLHFDHANGLTYRADSSWHPQFPKARHLIQKAEWEDAVGRLPELAGNYFPERLGPIDSDNLLELVDGSAEIDECIRVHTTGGHTRGHQAIEIRIGTTSAIYLGDLCPTSAHLKTFWTMAYDQAPLETRRQKPQWLEKIASENGILLFDHDPLYVAGTLRMNSRGQVELAQGFTREQLNGPDAFQGFLR